jgi:hypothetical protein
MGKYLLLMYNKQMRMPKSPTKRQMEEGMKPWRKYLGPLMKRGVIVASAPVEWNGSEVSKKGAKSHKSGKVDLGGYMLIKARSMAEATKIAKASPHARTGMGVTLIKECREMKM